MIHCAATPYLINNWLVLHLPDEASKQLPSRGQVMVKGTLNGHAFQTALEPDGNGGHWLHINSSLQKATAAKDGKRATLVFESTKDWPEPQIPADIKAALDANPRVFELWMDTTPMARWEWIRWIRSTNNPATRQNRIEVSCDKMLNGWRRPCCFNRNMCCVPEVSKSGVLLEPVAVKH